MAAARFWFRSAIEQRPRRCRARRVGLLAAVALACSLGAAVGAATGAEVPAPGAGDPAAKGGDDGGFAADRAALAARLETLDRYAATFTQTVFGVQGEVLERSEGYVRLDRPRFKWVVNEPYPQVLVTDDDELKLYDPDLEQLTVRPLEEALEDTPVSLLTRDAVQIGDRFDVMRVPDPGGDAFVIEPNAGDTLYREIVLHFDAAALRGLDILDQLGQRTEIRFTPDPGAKFDPGTFQLDVPPDTDVVGG